MSTHGKGPARGYRWPDATPGNTIAVQHGAYSSRVVDPLARSIIEDLLASPGCPQHLKDDPERWRATLDGYGRAEAIVVAVSGYLAGQDIAAALSETTEAEEVTTHRKGGSTRKTTAKRTQAALDVMHRWMGTARNYANDLGLSPAAAARMQLELADRYDSALAVKALLEHDQAEVAQ